MAKKNFKQNNPALTNPALAFISTPATEAEVQEEQPAQNAIKPTAKPPEGYKRNPEFIEVKSKRVQLLLQPSIVDAIKALAKEKGLSMNEAINEAIQEYLQRG